MTTRNLRRHSHSLLIGWAQATPRQLSAYERLHRELGLLPTAFIPKMARDALLSNTEPIERIRLAHQLIQNDRPHQKLFIHAFSENGLVYWAALCEQLYSLPGGRDVLQRVACILLDSAPGMMDQAGDEELANRIVMALNPAIARLLKRDEKKPVPGIQTLLPPVFRGYLKVFPKLGQFIRSPVSKLIRFGPRCPYLFWYGAKDILVQSDKVDRMRDAMRAEGIPFEVECFENAGHVSLWVSDPARYRKGLRQFLESNHVPGPGAPVPLAH